MTTSKEWTEANKRAPSPVPVISLADVGEWGPAMDALPTDRMRAFVYVYVQQGGRDHRRAYLAAGYKASTENVVGVECHKLLHDERIQAAIREESLKRMGGSAMAAASFLAGLLESDDPKVKTRDKMQAASMILNRVGLHETTEHKVTVKKEMNAQDKIDAAIALAKSLNLDPALLLGNIGIALPAPVSSVPEKAAEPTGYEGLEGVL